MGAPGPSQPRGRRALERAFDGEPSRLPAESTASIASLARTLTSSLRNAMGLQRGTRPHRARPTGRTPLPKCSAWNGVANHAPHPEHAGNPVGEQLAGPSRSRARALAFSGSVLAALTNQRIGGGILEEAQAMATTLAIGDGGVLHPDAFDGRHLHRRHRSSAHVASRVRQRLWAVARASRVLQQHSDRRAHRDGARAIRRRVELDRTCPPPNRAESPLGHGSPRLLAPPCPRHFGRNFPTTRERSMACNSASRARPPSGPSGFHRVGSWGRIATT